LCSASKKVEVFVVGGDVSGKINVEKQEWEDIPAASVTTRVFNDLIDDFTKSDFKSFGDDFDIFTIILKYGDLI
jgi:hypothetical protein